MDEPIEETSLLRVSDVVEPRFQHMFKHANFNHMQSAILDQALNSDCNMVVAAPTGSGKTVIHELAVVRLLSQNIRNPKTVFVAPNKALCQQRMREWDEKFKPLGQIVLEVTGDIDLKQCLRLIAKANIIITTPEKWDSLTRVWKDHLFLLGSIDLLLIDEVHHLGEDRGATLEALVVRMRMLSSVYQEKLSKSANPANHKGMRVIALSATLPNLADIGEWLGCSHDAIHYFDESFRPVPLKVHTLSMGSMNNPFLFDKSLDERVGPLILSYSEGKQVLVFCASKKSTETLCATLTQRIQIPREALAKARANSHLISSAHDDHLRDLLYKGVAYHHSGLPADDRALVEQLYLCGAVHILCCTSTLAHGVNLPAHLVVIKGTSSWRGGSRGYERTSRADVIQMLGRAGRPGMDDQGVAVIMTSREDQDFYADVSLSAEVVESKLQNNLVEAICAEVTQTVITNITDCIDWMKSTFFYVRVRKNPTKYGFEQFTDAAQLDALLCNLCTAAIGDLAGAGIIRFDQASEHKQITAHPEALIMTRSMVRFQTMDLLVKIPAAASIVQVLSSLCLSCELDKPVRRLEKRLLNDLMKSVRFPLKARVQEPQHKSCVLLQAAVARTEIKDFSLRVEQAEIVECALRVLGALRELGVQRELGPLLESAVLLDRALRTRMWESGFGSVFQQCPGLAAATANSLTLRGVRNLGDVEGCSVNRVQDLTGGSQAESRAILMFAKMLKSASRDVTAALEDQHLVIRIFPTYNSSTTSGAAEYPVDPSYPTYQLIAYDTVTSKALCIRSIERGARSLEFRVPAAQVRNIGDVKCCLLSNYVGIDSYQQATTQAANPSSANPGIAAHNRQSEGTHPNTAAPPTKPAAAKAPKAPKTAQAKTVVDNIVVYANYGRKDSAAAAVPATASAPSPARITQPAATGTLHNYFQPSPAKAPTAEGATQAVNLASAVPIAPLNTAATARAAPLQRRPVSTVDAPSATNCTYNCSIDDSAAAVPNTTTDGYYDQFDFDFADFSVPARTTPWQPPAPTHTSTATTTASYVNTKPFAAPSPPYKDKKAAPGGAAQYASPAKSHGSTGVGSTGGGGGGGGDIGIVRRKAAELELDRLPVQRLRSNYARRNDAPPPQQQHQFPQQAMASTQPGPAGYGQCFAQPPELPPQYGEYHQYPQYSQILQIPQNGQYQFQQQSLPNYWAESQYTVPSAPTVPMVTPAPPSRQYPVPQQVAQTSQTSGRKRFFDESDAVIPLSQEFDFCPPQEPQHQHQHQPQHQRQRQHHQYQVQQHQWAHPPPAVTPARYPAAAARYGGDPAGDSDTVFAPWDVPKENRAPAAVTALSQVPAAAAVHSAGSGGSSGYADRNACAAPFIKTEPVPAGGSEKRTCSSGTEPRAPRVKTKSALPSLSVPKTVIADEHDPFDSIFF